MGASDSAKGNRQDDFIGWWRWETMVVVEGPALHADADEAENEGGWRREETTSAEESARWVAGAV